MKHKKPDEFISKLRSLNINVVIFDFDLTVTTIHSFGILHEKDLPSFLNSPSQDFKLIVPHLIKAGFKVAIATFNDTRIKSFILLYGTASLRGNSYPDLKAEDIIAGEKLVKLFLEHNFDIEMAKEFEVVAFNPSLNRKKENRALNKNKHCEAIAKRFNCDVDQCVLFDDCIHNITTFEGKAFHVTGEVGFRLENLKV